MEGCPGGEAKSADEYYGLTDLQIAKIVKDVITAGGSLDIHDPVTMDEFLMPVSYTHLTLPTKA